MSMGGAGQPDGRRRVNAAVTGQVENRSGNK
jgi:hypothetical protein